MEGTVEYNEEIKKEILQLKYHICINTIAIYSILCISLFCFFIYILLLLVPIPIFIFETICFIRKNDGCSIISYISIIIILIFCVIVIAVVGLFPNLFLCSIGCIAFEDYKIKKNKIIELKDKI